MQDKREDKTDEFKIFVLGKQIHQIQLYSPCETHMQKKKTIKSKKVIDTL